MLHWVRIDLTAPGIALYVTPLDLKALLEGWQYRLRRIKDVIDRDHLAVAINASLFTSNSPWLIRMPGDLARGVETVVADHVFSHLWEHTYLLWFDDQLEPAFEFVKAADSSRIWRVQNGVLVGRVSALRDGQVWPGSVVSRIREPPLRSIKNAGYYFSRSVKTFRHISYFKSLQNTGQRTECCWMAEARVRWPSGRAPQAFDPASCTAAGDRWRRISG